MDGLQNFLDHSGGLCQTNMNMVVHNSTQSAVINATTSTVTEESLEFDSCVEVRSWSTRIEKNPQLNSLESLFVCL